MDTCNIAFDAHNVTVDNFCQTPGTPNKQGENENGILISESLNNLDALSETLKGSTINDAGYYTSEKMTQKAILKAIQGYLLTLVTERKEKLWTLETEICNKHY